MLAGASAPTLSNGGTISATLTGDAPSASRAIVVEPGASLPVILNSGTIKAVSEGSSGGAAAIVDRAGSLTHLENVGTISARTVAPGGSAIVPTGSAVAIDDSANTTGFSLLSYQAGGGLPAPSIVGAILMGSGDDSLNIQAGSLTGDLSFGAGANSLTIDGGSNVEGAVTADGGTLALSVGAGSLKIDNAETLALTGINLGAASTTTFTIDPAAGKATELDVAGPAVIAPGAKIGLRMTSILNGSATYALVRSAQLTAGGQSLLGVTPYLYEAQLAVDPSAGALSVTVARKTAAELALPASVTGAYEPVVAAVAKDPTLSAALLGQTTRGGFMSAYQQLLPEHSGGIFRMVAEGVESFGRPLDDRQGGGSGGLWAQEMDFVARGHNTGDLAGYNSWGLGLIGGYELPANPLGIFGLTVGGFSGQLDPHHSADASDAIANLLEFGGYWRTAFGHFSVNARVAGDYLMAKSHRATNFSADAAPAYTGVATAHWNGWGLSSRVRASYDERVGDFYLRPQAGIDFLQLSEDAHDEHGGGALDLSIERRKTTELSGFVGVAGGAIFGGDSAFWSPELLLGYRDALSKSGGETTARFDSGGDPFVVGPNPIGDGGFVARVAIKSESGPAAFSLEAGGETRSHFTVVDAKIAAHLSF
jgi:hypothetical protein